MEPFQLVCASPEMRRIAETIRKSGTRALLLTGETGVGKDALARWAHSISPHKKGRFVSINCAAIQESLWESEIFGHAKGAFTGADRDKGGHIEEATEGTLFLNEIGDMPLPTQAKLLTFLDTHEFQRVGETKTRSVTTRIISATNRDLEREIEKGSFRRDLFYRLAVVHARIPPLRERPADVVGLAKAHLHSLVRDRKAGTVDLAPSTHDLLVEHSWKGNARELEAMIETAFERCLESGGKNLIPDYFAPELIGARETVDKQEPSLISSKSLKSTVQESAMRATEITPPQNSQPIVPTNSLLEDPPALRAFLDQYKTPSGRGNLSAAHRVLVESGQLKIGRRAFALRIQKIFPDG